MGAWPVSEHAGSQIDENEMGIDGGGDELDLASESGRNGSKEVGIVVIGS